MMVSGQLLVAPTPFSSSSHLFFLLPSSSFVASLPFLLEELDALLFRSL